MFVSNSLARLLGFMRRPLQSFSGTGSNNSLSNAVFGSSIKKSSISISTWISSGSRGEAGGEAKERLSIEAGPASVPGEAARVRLPVAARFARLPVSCESWLVRSSVSCEAWLVSSSVSGEDRRGMYSGEDGRGRVSGEDGRDCVSSEAGWVRLEDAISVEAGDDLIEAEEDGPVSVEAGDGDDPALDPSVCETGTGF